MRAQILSNKQAIDFAEKLHEVEILSDKGKELLIDHIEKGDFERTKQPNLLDGSMEITNNLSVSQILIFLSKAFGSELYYRTGILEQNKLIKETQEQTGKAILTQKDYDSIQEHFYQNIEDFEGWKIEKSIIDEESFPEESRTIHLDGFSMPNMEENGLIHGRRSALGKTCTRTLEDLFSIGLIDKVIYDEVFNAIKRNELTIEAYVTVFAGERAIFYEDFKENKSKEINFIKELNEVGVISDIKLKELIDSYKPKELKSKFDILEYCSNTKIFHLNDYSNSPEIGYKEIFFDIKSLVPNFEFKNFKSEITEPENQWSDDLIEQKVLISFKVDDVVYHNSFFYDYRRKVPKENEMESDTLLKINNNFHKGINKLLADRNSEYRLYYANRPENGKYYGKQKFGLTLLTEEQFETWGTYNSDYFLFSQSHDNSFNTLNILRLIETYKEIGLFDHLDESEIKKGEDCINEMVIDSYQSILSCFPKTIVYFDWESGNLENPYEELTISFAEASRGKFQPTKIVDTFEKSWEKETTQFSFDLNGKNYSTDLEMNTDWLNPKFMELIEHAMLENSIDSEIYYCIEDGQATGYILLTKKQYEILNSRQPDLFVRLQE